MKFLLFILAFGCIVSVGKTQSIALFIDGDYIDEPVNAKAYDEIVTEIRDRMQINSWNYYLSRNQVTLDTSYRKSEGEPAADYLLTVNFEIYEEYELGLRLDKDTTNKVIGAHFPIGTFTNYRFVLTDLRTHEIVQFLGKRSKTYEEYNNGKKIAVSLDELKKYFGAAGPVALQAKSNSDYNAALAKITAAYKPHFHKYYDENRIRLSPLIGTLLRNLIIRTPEPILNPVVENGKLKSLEIKNHPSVKFYDGMYITVFSLDTIGDYVIPNNFKHWVIDGAGAQTCRAETKFLIASKDKDAAEALAQGKKLYYMPGSVPYATHLAKEEQITIDVQGNELQKEVQVFNFLARSPRMRIINSMESFLIDKFHERYKGIDFVETGYTVAALGASVILSSSDEDYIIQDAKSGTVIGSCPKKFGDKGVYDLLQKSLQLKVQVIKPLDAKKEVLKEALVYSPMGFYEDFFFDVMLVTPETVNGKTLYRETELGKGNIFNEEKYGYIFGEAKFNKGEKEIGAAYFGKQQLLFVSREFKFPFVGSFK